MKIIKARNKDLDTIFRIIQTVNIWMIKRGKEYWRGFYKKEKIKKGLAKKEYYLLIEDYKPIGTFRISETRPDLYSEKRVSLYKKIRGKILYPSSLAIIPSQQHKGYGRKVMEFLETYAKKHKFKAIMFDTTKERKKLNEFYKRLGYRVMGFIKGKQRDGNIYYKSVKA